MINNNSGSNLRNTTNTNLLIAKNNTSNNQQSSKNENGNNFENLLNQTMKSVNKDRNTEESTVTQEEVVFWVMMSRE